MPISTYMYLYEYEVGLCFHPLCYDHKTNNFLALQLLINSLFSKTSYSRCTSLISACRLSSIVNHEWIAAELNPFSVEYSPVWFQNRLIAALQANEYCKLYNSHQPHHTSCLFEPKYFPALCTKLKEEII
jgi:hypothetical protein